MTQLSHEPDPGNDYRSQLQSIADDPNATELGRQLARHALTRTDEPHDQNNHDSE